jgi:predicted ATPase/DNA-binding SARP family transcriptional activator/tetratricopeptide (TPR) repeat protein
MLHIQLLGSVEAVAGDAALPLGGPKQRTVLAVLAVGPGKRVSVDRLVEAVWGDEVPERASRSISTFVSNLRGVLGDVIVRNGNGYLLQVDRKQVDAARFADRVAVGQRSDGESAAAELREALALWIGTPFGGVDGHHVLEPEITRLTELQIAATESAIDAELASGRDVDLIELDRLVLEHPHRERIRGLHMRALYSAGRQAEALTSYKSFREQLATDLGIDPSPELQKLELQILQQDAALSPQRPSPTAGGQAALPIRYSSFVGRADEITAVSTAITTDRLVTVVGPGGIGKSSLVVEAARLPEVHRGDQVARVVIDSLAKGEVVPAVVRVLGLDPAPGVEPIEVIAGYLASNPHLLILDGCEGDLGVVATLVDRVLSASPHPRVLATSREPLGLSGESLIRVAGLDGDAAIDLFADRAGLGSNAEHAGRDKVGDLCATLDGMPLAIELAAARARSLPLDRLMRRLDDLIPLLAKSRVSGDRHDSMTSALAWSYDLLGADEQRALRWLSVFPTGFDRRDAEALLDDPYAEDVVSRLVDVSLVQPADESGRNRILEPVRQYARSLLEQDGEHDQIAERYARWIADEAQRVGVDLWSPNARAAGAWIHSQHSELLAAIDWAIKHDQPDIAVQILAAICHRVMQEGDANSLVDRALNTVLHPAASRTAELAIASAHTVMLVWKAGRSAEALEVMELAEDIVEVVADPVARAEVMHRRAVIEGESSGVDGESTDKLDAAIDQLFDSGAINAPFYIWNRALYRMKRGLFEEAMAAMDEREEWWIATMGLPDPDGLQVQGDLRRLSGDRRACVEMHLRAADLYRAESAFESERLIWQYVIWEAIALDDRDLFSEAMEACRRAGQRTGFDADFWVRVCAASYERQHAEVLSLSRLWADEVAAEVRRDGARHLEVALRSEPWRESPFFVMLLPIALALEATGQVEDAHRIAREGPGLMAQDKFPHTGPAGQADRWAEVLDRLGGGEPEGLTVEAAFDMVHGMLAGDPT